MSRVPPEAVLDAPPAWTSGTYCLNGASSAFLVGFLHKVVVDEVNDDDHQPKHDEADATDHSNQLVEGVLGRVYVLEGGIVIVVVGG